MIIFNFQNFFDLMSNWGTEIGLLIATIRHILSAGYI